MTKEQIRTLSEIMARRFTDGLGGMPEAVGTCLRETYAEGFRSGVKSVMQYLCDVPFDKALGELAEYARNITAVERDGKAKGGGHGND